MDNYHIISFLGEGAYGKVYKGRLKHSGHLVALKKMSKRGKTARELRNLRKEIGILKKLRHENIILMLDWFETPSEIIVVTELAQGELTEILDTDGHLEEEPLRDVARQLVSAFHYLHHHRIIHRDIKPQNVLLGANGVVKLCDFGFARAMSDETNLLHSIKGTPLYMAPELIQGKPYDQFADLWSLGIVLYELATGGTPFSGSQMMNVLTLIAKNPVSYPSTMGSDLRNLLEGLLQKNPAKRLGWPHLLNHPFLRQSEEEKLIGKDSLAAERQRLEDNILFEQTTVLAGLKMEDGAMQYSGLTIDVDAKTLDEIDDGEEAKEPGSPVNLHVLFAREQSRDLEAARDRLRDDRKFLNELNGWLVAGVERPEAVQIAATRICLEIVTNLSKIQSRHKFLGDIDDLHNVCLTTMSQMIGTLTLNLNFFSSAPDRKEELLCDVLKACNVVATEAFKTAKPGIAGDYPNGFIQYFKMLRSRKLLNTHVIAYMKTLLLQAGKHPNNSSGFYAVIWKFKVPLELTRLEAKSSPEDLQATVPLLACMLHPTQARTENFPYGDGTGAKIVKPGFPELGGELRQMTYDALLAGKCMPILLEQLRDSNAEVVSASLKVLLASTRCNAIPAVQSITESGLSTLAEVVSRVCEDSLPDSSVPPQALALMLLSSLGSVALRSVLSLLPVARVFELLGSANFAINVAASLLLVQYAFSLPDTRGTILQCLCQQTPMAGLLGILTRFQSGLNMADLDGSGFGFPENGPLDGPVRLLSDIIRSTPHDAQASLLLVCWRSEIVSTITVSLQCIRTARAFSLTGLSSALDVVARTVARALKDQETLSVCVEGLFEALLCMIHDSQLKLILAWPATHGGGQQTVVLIFKQVLSTLCIPYLPEVPRVVMAKAQKAFHNDVTVRHVISAMQYCADSDLALPLGFIRQLIEPEVFLRQFLEIGGLACVKSRDLLLPSHSPGVLTETLQIISSVARSSQHLAHVHSANVYAQLLPLLNHTESIVRGACCQTIAQLCTHIIFCAHMKRQGVFEALINHINDTQEEARRSSCVAIGAALSHDSGLLPSFLPAIPSLVATLQDSHLKVRTGAAGALGSFLKLPEALQPLIEARAVESLAEVISRTDLEGKENDRDNLRRHALVSLCHFAALPEGKTMLLNLKIPDLLKQIPHRHDGKAADQFVRLEGLLA